MKNTLRRLMWLAAASVYSKKIGPHERAAYQEKFGISRMQMQRDLSGFDPDSVPERCPLPEYLEDVLSPSGAFMRIEQPRRATPDSHTIQNVVSAILSKTVLTCRYASASSGASFKKIAPSIVVDVCGRLHVRGFDISKRRHADFVLARMSGASDTGEAPEVRIPPDEEMGRRVMVQITPADDLPAESLPAIEADYGMISGLRTDEIPEAFTIYLSDIYGVPAADAEGRDQRRPIKIKVSKFLK